MSALLLVKLKAKLEDHHSNRPKPLDLVYKRVVHDEIGYDFYAYERDLNLHYEDERCLKLAIKRISDEMGYNRAMALIGE